VARYHLRDKTGLRLADILDRLAGHRVGQKSDEVAGMTRGQHYPDLAVVFHAADAGAMPGARVKDDKRPLALVDRGAHGREDPHQPVIHRTRQRTAIEHELEIKAQHIRHLAGVVLDAIIATPAQYIQQ